ncbi:MAG: hypothetical protein IPJ47_22020 [Anaerolineales bacterium]|nr:hypothetical protein [Anaerolineales bacterium]
MSEFPFHLMPGLFIWVTSMPKKLAALVFPDIVRASIDGTCVAFAFSERFLSFRQRKRGAGVFGRALVDPACIGGDPAH